MAWFDAAWGHRVKITIQASKIDATLTDKDLYVDLSDLDTDFWANVKSDGGDLRVTQSDGTTQQAVSIKNFDGGTDTGQLRFKASTVSSSVNTEFYIYYGNSGASQPAADSTYGSENVPDSNYKLYCSLEEDPSGTPPQILDLTSNDNHGTTVNMEAADLITGVVGSGLNFDPTVEEVTHGNSTTLETLMGQSMTFECWVYFDVSNQYEMIVSRIGQASNYPGWEIFKRNDNKIEFQVIETWTANRIAVYTTNTVSSGSWMHLVCTYDGSADVSGMAIRIDCASQSLTTRFNTGSGSGTTQDLPYRTASRDIGGSPWENLDGSLDEIRFSNSIRAAAWTDASCDNQLDTSTFYSVGSQEDAPTMGRSRAYIL